MDNLIGINSIIKIKQECGLLGFNECSVFHQVAVVSAGTSLSLASSSARWEWGSLCAWDVVGLKGWKGRRRISYQEALVHWKIKVTVWVSQEQDSGSKCLLPDGGTPYWGSSSWKIHEQTWIPRGKLCESHGLSVAPTRSNAVLSLDLKCLSQLVLGSSFQLYLVWSVIFITSSCRLSIFSWFVGQQPACPANPCSHVTPSACSIPIAASFLSGSSMPL